MIGKVEAERGNYLCKTRCLRDFYFECLFDTCKYFEIDGGNKLVKRTGYEEVGRNEE